MPLRPRDCPPRVPRSGSAVLRRQLGRRLRRAGRTQGESSLGEEAKRSGRDREFAWMVLARRFTIWKNGSCCQLRQVPGTRKKSWNTETHGRTRKECWG